MKILSAKYIYNEGGYYQNKAVAFNNKIIKIAPINELKTEFPEAKIKEFKGNYVIYPGFINPHVHLEFSANKATLKLGDFLEWLYSVINYRQELIEKLDNLVIKDAINQMLRSGVTTFGAISSFGAELNECVKTPLRVIYFNEVIGSNPAMVDALFSDFKVRLNNSLKFKSDNFYPSIAIHSPYSVHPILLKEVLKIAKDKNLITTAHFLESNYEYEWLNRSSGKFKEFFEKFFNTSKAITSIDEFLNSFNNHPTLFTHLAAATNKELEIINKNNHSVIHCPRSNRLLGCDKLDISKVNRLLLATDGLSSNFSLSILDELKAALFMHNNFDLNELALKLIKAVTTNASEALNLKIGKILPEFFADFAVFKLPKDLKTNSAGTLALHTIINNTSATSVYINGEKIF